MAYQIIILASVLAYANAGFLGAPAVAVPAAPALAVPAAPALAVKAAPAIAYSAAPAVSHVSYSSPSLSISGPAISSQSSNIYRTFGNLGQISTYSKTIDTPFSSVRKADLRVSNPGLRFSEGAPIAYAAQAAPLAYAAPAAPLAYAAPAAHLTTYHAPAAVAAAPAAIGVAYSAAPAVSHVTFNGLAASYGW